MKNTPRDFFIHFGAFAALYSATIAFITLLFQMIDYAYPDPLYNSYYYSDPYSGPMRFAIASLIILVPIFLYLMRSIQRDARREPQRYSLGIRRWLTYITLFVAGATIIGDLITLLYSFLGGEFATTFLLKVFALGAITSVIFWYFLFDILAGQRTEIKNNRLEHPRCYRARHYRRILHYGLTEIATRSTIRPTTSARPREHTATSRELLAKQPAFAEESLRNPK